MQRNFSIFSEKVRNYRVLFFSVCYFYHPTNTSIFKSFFAYFLFIFERIFTEIIKTFNILIRPIKSTPFRNEIFNFKWRTFALLLFAVDVLDGWNMSFAFKYMHSFLLIQMSYVVWITILNYMRNWRSRMFAAIKYC